MTSAFAFRLNRSLADLPIPAAVLHDLQANEIRLAALTVPAGIDAPMAAAIRVSIERAFVFGFRLVMLICAGLSLASAAVAWQMITTRKVTSPTKLPLV